MKGRHPLVSIIVINLNGGRVFEDCLRSLSNLMYPNWELIIVDNASTDQSVDLVKKFSKLTDKYQIIRNKDNFGFAKANNQGYKISKGKYLLILNNDTKVKANFLSELVSRMEEDPSLGITQPKIFLMGKPNYLDNAGSFFTRIGFLHHWGFLQKDGAEFSTEREIFSAKGACMLVKKEMVDKIGLFDEDFFSYFEESDFCWRVWLSGHRVLFCPQASIYHKVGFTIKRLNVGNINYHYYKNRVCSLIKNLELKNLFYILPPHFIISVGIALIFLIRRQPDNSLMIVRALVWNLLNINRTMWKRLTIQKTRKVKDRQLFSKLLVPIDYGKYWESFRRVEQDLKK